VWTADKDSGGMAATANDRFAVRRAGLYNLHAHAYVDVALADAAGFGVVLWKNGTATLIGTNKSYASTAQNIGVTWHIDGLLLAAGDTVNYQFLSDPGSKLLRGGSGYVSYFSGVEVLQ